MKKISESTKATLTFGQLKRLVFERRYNNAKGDWLTPDEEAVADELQEGIAALVKKAYSELRKLGVSRDIAQAEVADIVEHASYGLHVD